MEMCPLLLKHCFNERIYQPCYGLVAERICVNNKAAQNFFEISFRVHSRIIHGANTGRVRSAAKFYADLLGLEAISWDVLAYLHLTEDETRSSSRIFIENLFLELSNELGIDHLNERLSDPTIQHALESIFPKNSPRNARFAIDFFRAIGLNSLTEHLRQHLETMPGSNSESNTDLVALDHSDSESD